MEALRYVIKDGCEWIHLIETGREFYKDGTIQLNRVCGISCMRHEGKLGKCRYFNVRKSVGVLVLVGKSNKDEKYNILIYERVI